MSGERKIMKRPGRWRGAATAAAVVVMSGGVLAASTASAQSITDRFKSLFGGSSSDNAVVSQPSEPGENDLTCPTVSIRPGAATFAVGMPGKTAAGNDLRYQATITRTARDCNLVGGEITARIGIQGRVIAGPAGAPATIDVPLRVALVQEGVSPKTIATKVYQTTVQMGGDTSVPFSLVGEDLVYPVPIGAAGDSYIFYIGFDPQALKPEPRPKGKKK